MLAQNQSRQSASVNERFKDYIRMAFHSIGTAREDFLRAACHLSPEHFFAIAEKSYKEGRHNDAWNELAMIIKAARSPVTQAHALNLLGMIQLKRYNLVAAQNDLQRASALDRKSAAIAHNVGICFLWKHDLVNAEKWLETAKRIEPKHDTLMALANIKILTGRTAEGFNDTECRWNLPGAPKPYNVAPRWKGEPLQGKQIFVYGEQGHGDIMFCLRYLPALFFGCAKVWLMVPPEFERLLAPWWGNICHNPTNATADYEIPMMSLPALLERVSHPFPITSYLKKVKPEAQNRIGLVWSGSAANPIDEARSIPVEMLRALTECGETFVSLQVGPKSIQSETLGIEDMSPLIKDWQDTANIIASCKAVVTCDTAIAHLGGAMGIPTFVLISKYPDWRYGLEGKHSPWYGNHMELFRQEIAGDWSHPIQQVKERIKSL